MIKIKEIFAGMGRQNNIRLNKKVGIGSIRRESLGKPVFRGKISLKYSNSA